MIIINEIKEKTKSQNIKKIIKIVIILAIVIIAIKMIEIYIKANYRLYTGVILYNDGKDIIIDSDELMNIDYFDAEYDALIKEWYGHKVKIGDSIYASLKYIVHINKSTKLKDIDGKKAIITDFNAGDKVKLLIRKNTKERNYIETIKELDNAIFIKKINEGEI